MSKVRDTFRKVIFDDKPEKRKVKFPFAVTTEKRCSFFYTMSGGSGEVGNVTHVSKDIRSSFVKSHYMYVSK